MENMTIYNKYKSVPQEALKAFDNGKFKGTDINTMWRIKSLTEAFGMCGIGWYFTTKRLWVETTINNEQFAFAEIELFVKVDGEWSKAISGNGGNKLARLTKNGDYSTSDEAFKMAVTDALGVACRNLGFGADVYWANDKTKYTEYEQPKQEVKPQPKTAPKPKKEPVSIDTSDAPTDEQLKELKELGGSLEVLSNYYGIPEYAITSEQVQKIIDRKKKQLAKGEQK